MDNKNVIASALTDYELARAFSELVAERWDNWDLSEFLPYLIDVCAPAALPYLADQFDVDGLRGFGMAINEEQQRDIIKRSIALHKYLGTPWAIREACRTVGFPVIILEEGVTEVPGGPESPEDWARFRVLVEADVARHITLEESHKLRLFVEFYKNERSHLVELGFFQPFTDKLFRDVAEHDELAVWFLSLNPNPVNLDPFGTPVKVTAFSNVGWTIENTVIDWDDGSNDKIMLEFTGALGSSEIVVKSDVYVGRVITYPNAYSPAYSTAYHWPSERPIRTKKVNIVSTDGIVVGILTITQKPGIGNAYSRAYSNAYNLFDNN